MALDLGTLVGHLELESDKFEGVLDKLPAKLKGSGVAMGAVAAVAAAGVGAALAKGVDTGLDLQDAQNSLQAQLGLTTSESQRLGGVAGKLYASAYGDSIEATSDAVSDVVSSIGGMKNANASAVEAMTAKVLNFNTTFGVETSRTTQIVGQLLSSGLVKSADEGMDLLTASLQRVPKSVREDVLDAADEYSPFFKQLGFSGAQSFGVLVEGAKKGQFGIDKAGDALKEFSIRATDLTDTNAQASLKALGLDGKTMADDLLAGGSKAQGAFQQITRGLLGVKDPGKQAYLSTQLFGTQLEDLNKGQLKGFLGSLSSSQTALGNTAGAADKMGKAVNGGARVGFTELTRSFEMTIGVVGQKLVPLLTAVIDVLNKNPAILGIVVGLVGALAVAFLALSVAGWIAAAAESAAFAPILLIVAAVALLAAGIYLLVTHWGAVVGFLQGVWGGFVGWFMGILNTVLGFFGSIGASILSTAISGWGQITAWFAGIPGAVLGFFAGVGSWLLGVGRSLIAGLMAGITAGAQLLWQFYVVLPLKILGFLAGAASWLIGVGRQALAGMVSGVVAGAVALWSFFTGLHGRVIGFLGAASSWLLGIGRSVISGMVSGVSGAIGLVANVVGTIKNAVTGAVGGAGKWLLNVGKQIIQGLIDGIRGAIGGVKDLLGSVTKLIPDWKGPASLDRVLLKPNGKLIMGGLIDGISSQTGLLHSTLAGITTAIPASVSVAGMSGALGRSMTLSGAPGAAGAMVDASVTINGNVGWSKADLDAERASRVNTALALHGLDTELVTA